MNSQLLLSSTSLIVVLICLDLPQQVLTIDRRLEGTNYSFKR
jgi:hypothetical protein